MFKNPWFDKMSWSLEYRRSIGTASRCSFTGLLNSRALPLIEEHILQLGGCPRKGFDEGRLPLAFGDTHASSEELDMV